MGYHPRWDMSVVSWRVSPWRTGHLIAQLVIFKTYTTCPLCSQMGIGESSLLIWDDFHRFSKVAGSARILRETPRKIEMDRKKNAFSDCNSVINMMLQPLIFRLWCIKVNLAVQKHGHAMMWNTSSSKIWLVRKKAAAHGVRDKIPHTVVHMDYIALHHA